jgi:hypothetical protein
MIIFPKSSEAEVRAFREEYERAVAGSREAALNAGPPLSFRRAIGLWIGAWLFYGLTTALVRFMFSPLSQGGAIVRLPPYDNDVTGLYAMLLPPTQDQIMNDELASNEPNPFEGIRYVYPEESRAGL